MLFSTNCNAIRRPMLVQCSFGLQIQPHFVQAYPLLVQGLMLVWYSAPHTHRLFFSCLLTGKDLNLSLSLCADPAAPTWHSIRPRNCESGKTAKRIPPGTMATLRRREISHMATLRRPAAPTSLSLSRNTSRPAVTPFESHPNSKGNIYRSAT